jgi:hypothetical protein
MKDSTVEENKKQPVIPQNGFTEITTRRESLANLVNLDTWVTSDDLTGLQKQSEATVQLIKDSCVFQ